MNKFVTIIVAVTLLIIGIVGAAFFLYPYEPKKPPRADDSDSTLHGIQEVASSNNKFAFELYSRMKNYEENFFFSPYSIYAALAITYEGAKGKTAEEIKKVFHFPESRVLKPNFAAIYNSLNEEQKNCELKTGNALWIQKDHPLLEDYKSRVEKYYGAKAANLDFTKEESRQMINNFIEEQTNGKIKDLIPKGSLDPTTRLVITNAIYFKGTWLWEFDPKNTREMDFKVNQTKVVKVPMMCMKPDKPRFNYVDLDDLQILELPYKGEKISMLILLPKENLERIDLTAEKIEEWKSKMEETKLDSICIPKFELKTKYLMNDHLKALGMPTAFTIEADFSGMSKEKLFINFVIHQAYVKVDEKGTEAAAATAVTMVMTTQKMKEFKADRPFIFIIQEKITGNILFIGRIVDPTK
ncbi:MAG: serpin family protein [Candidatus Pacearchaeota archaeon]